LSFGDLGLVSWGVFANLKDGIFISQKNRLKCYSPPLKFVFAFAFEFEFEFVFVFVFVFVFAFVQNRFKCCSPLGQRASSSL
jgi:hypothetical protein